MPRTASKKIPPSKVLAVLRELHADAKRRDPMAYTTRAVAARAKMPYPTVSDWLRGREPQAFALLEKLAAVYGRRLVLEPLDA